MQGLSVGMVTGAATAGLVELEPHGDRARAALYAVIVQGAGSSAGPLLAGVLAQWAPEPRVLCYLVALVLALLAAVAVLTIPEAKPSGGRWRMQRPSVPPEIRAGFWRASLTAGTVWMVAALYLSVVPSYAAKLLDTGNLALLGAIAGSLLAASCVAQLIASRRDGTAGAQPLGLALVVAGLAALVLAFPLHSLAALFASALLGGAGHGLAFLGAQAEINELAPIERRGEVTAAFISCIYSGVAASAIGVGLLSTALSLRTAVTIFAVVVGSTALTAIAWHIATRLRAPQVAALSSARSRACSARRARTSSASTLALSAGALASAARAGRSRAKRSAASRTAGSTAIGAPVTKARVSASLGRASTSLPSARTATA